jgi:hypothetical protein
MKYVILLLVAFAVAACGEKEVGGSTERIEVQRFDPAAYEAAQSKRRAQDAAFMETAEGKKAMSEKFNKSQNIPPEAKMKPLDYDKMFKK